MPSKKNNEAWRRDMERRYYLEIIDLVKAFPSALPVLTVSQWAEEHRILSPAVTPMPGPFRWEVAPYMREIADCFSESSPVQKVAVIKGAQVAFTTAVLENVIGYIIAAAPGPAMFISSDKGVAEASVELRIDAMIESAGLGDRIFAQVEKAHNKKTGDTKARKDFAGGFLMALGPRVGAKLRSFPNRYLLCDELDAWPEQIGSTSNDAKTASEGDPLVLAEKRTVAFERIRKILYGSTPLIRHSSRILELFEYGDQRYFYVPCRHCLRMQILRWKDKDGTLRIKYEEKDGKLDLESVHYICENPECGKPWKNSDKAWFLPRGEWRPTSENGEANFRSYHISSLYSPIGMRSWEDICLEWLHVKDEPLKLKAFINTVLGEPWEEKGETPKTEKVMAQIEAGEYHIDKETGEVLALPPTANPLLVSVGADVQADRIEVEIVAWGIGFESWSLGYLSLPGPTDDINSLPWKALQAALMERHADLQTDFALVDCGYNTDVVYDFCASLSNVLPVKGDPGLQEDKSSKSKVLRLSDVRERGIQRADINVDYFKGEIYGHIRKGTESGQTPIEPFPGFCHFPAEYTRRYANMLTAERRVLQPAGRTGRAKMVWKQQGRNEALDCRVYALAALYVMFRYKADEQEAWYREKGIKEFPHYTWADFWDFIIAAKKAPIDLS